MHKSYLEHKKKLCKKCLYIDKNRDLWESNVARIDIL